MPCAPSRRLTGGIDGNYLYRNHSRRARPLINLNPEATKAAQKSPKEKPNLLKSDNLTTEPFSLSVST
jgi:hypothetical protein